MAFFCSNLLSKTLTPKTMLIKLKTPKMAASMSSLIGPPELKNLANQPNKGYTENSSPTYLSSGNPCVDFFFQVVPHTPFESVQESLRKAWNHDSLTSLKLICNLRGVRGTGKSDKEGFYAAALWLHQYHPKTLALNVPAIVNFGYSKDFLEILYRILEGPDVRKKEKKLWLALKRGTVERSVKTSSEREEIRLALAKQVLDRYHNDSDFRLLHEKVSDFFAECLKADMERLKNNETTKLSFAGKWCPSLFSSFDNETLLCESIARKIFPRESYPEYEGVEEEHYAYRIRDRLRKEVLTPLRMALDLPELYMSMNRWGEIPYNRVASVAMTIYEDSFIKHDKERFTEYLMKVASGDAKIAAGALLPHQIIKSLTDKRSSLIADFQWKRMVNDLLQEGKLKNCLAISDVSGSMSGEPMEVSVALGLLVSELSEEPWKGKLITFSRNPILQIVKGNTLSEKVECIEEMYWNCNTDFQKVFDVILEVAVKGGLKEEEMIKRLFVFSDMEFDQASLNPWETDYEAIVRKFTEKGYGNVIPEIVFWNLRDSGSTPVTATQEGVALVSGFSKNLVKLFLDGTIDEIGEIEETDEEIEETEEIDENGEINKIKETKKTKKIDPVSVMEAAISKEEYQNLVVFD